MTGGISETKNPGIFTVLGPVMIGPSSSHTAGAVKIGLLAKAIFGRSPRKVDIFLHGSFRTVGRGHGTYEALVAGLLVPSCTIDDYRIPDSLSIVREMGISVRLHDKTDIGDGYHPNTAKFILQSDNEKMKILGSSTGGGRATIVEIDSFKHLENMGITGDSYALIVFCDDRIGLIADVSRIIGRKGRNISSASYRREMRLGKAILATTLDKPATRQILDQIKSMKGVHGISVINIV